MIDILQKNDSSWFGRLSVRLKLTICFGASCGAVLLDSLLSLSILTLLSAMAFFLSRPTWSQTRLVLLLLGFVVWGVMLSQGLFYNHFPKDPILTIIEPNRLFQDGLRIYLQGLHHGAVQSCRMVSIGLCGYAVCFSTQPDDFLKGFAALKVPFSLAFMAVTAIQFIPVAVQAIIETRTAMALKGYRPLRRGFKQTVKTEIGAFRAVLAGTIRRSEEKALSILTRGFDIAGKRTAFHEDKLKPIEGVAATTVLFAVAALITVKSLFWLYQSEVWSTSALRGLYAFSREWL